jgi:hypothetical protein
MMSFNLALLDLRPFIAFYFEYLILKIILFFHSYLSGFIRSDHVVNKVIIFLLNYLLLMYQKLIRIFDLSSRKLAESRFIKRAARLTAYVIHNISENGKANFYF